MQQAESIREDPDEDGVDMDVDSVFGILSNRRRRFVLHYLLQQDRAVDLRELSNQVTAWENGIDLEEVTYKQRKRVYTALRQTHLPTMDDEGVISYDSQSGSIEPTPSIQNFDIYVDVVEGNELPWSQYYLGLGLLFCAVTAATAVVPLPPFEIIPALWVAALFAIALSASGAVHSYLAYHRRLGSDGLPPEDRRE